MAPETPSPAGSLDLPPSFAQRVRRGSVAMSINLIVAAVILGGGSIVEATVGVTGPAPGRSWLVYLGVVPALSMVVLALAILAVRQCLDGDSLDLAKVEAIRPGLRMWWIATVASALAVIVLILVFDLLAHTSSSGSAIIGALPPFLIAVVANTSYGTSKSWLNPKLD
jgi:hypothetical protein